MLALLVFEVIFSILIITWIVSIGGERGMVGEGKWGAEGGQSNHSDTNSSAVPSVGRKNLQRISRA